MKNIPHEASEIDLLKCLFLNIFLIFNFSIAVGFAESKKANKVYYGAHEGNHVIYPDCRIDFQKNFSKAVELGTYNKVKILAPYQNLNKAGILKIGIKLKIDYAHTHTCYSPGVGGVSCGKCGSCQERLSAFKEIGIKDPLNYITRELISKK